MANGFDKLEKLFGGSKKKERSAARKKVVVVSSACSPASEGRTFPSPSYLRPTSMHMVARPEASLLSQSKERSLSLPGSENQPGSASSSYYGSSDEEWKARTSSSTLTSSVATGSEQNQPSTPRLSAFRFPENAIFRQDGAAHLSTDASPREASNIDTPPETLETVAESGGLIDWSPKHISLLFNGLDLSSTAGTKDDVKGHEVAESMVLMPSPLFSTSSRPNHAISHSETLPVRVSSSRSSTVISERKFSLFPKQYSPVKPLLSTSCSSSISDGERDVTSIKFDRSRSVSELFPAIKPAAAESATMASLEETSGKDFGRRGVRETWDSRHDGPSLDNKELNNSDGLPRSHLRNTQSVLTLSTVNSKIAKDHVLQEPTFDDFYALSDEDIAEARPATPTPNMLLLPSPSPKDKPKSTPAASRERRTPQKRGTPVAITSAPTTAINPDSGEMTPPDTPTDCQFLALMQPANHPGALGALMAAGIAKNYGFDVVYVISLWPSSSGSHLDPSRRASPKAPQRSRSSGCSINPYPKSGITGRFLAAFGLNEVASPEAPFPIYTKVHLQTLGSEEWKECRFSTKSPGEISRGLICSFYGDHVPVARSSVDEASNTAMNRGIVFAAYTKHKNTSIIPTKATPERSQIQGRLRSDVKTLVDTLIKK